MAKKKYADATSVQLSLDLNLPCKEDIQSSTGNGQSVQSRDDNTIDFSHYRKSKDNEVFYRTVDRLIRHLQV